MDRQISSRIRPVHIGIVLQKDLDTLNLLEIACNVKRGLATAIDGIHVSLLLKENLDNFELAMSNSPEKKVLNSQKWMCKFPILPVK